MLTLNLDKSVERKLKTLWQSDPQAFLLNTIDKEITQLKKTITNIELDLKTYEKKYKMSSNTFYSKWKEGILSDMNNDFFEWSAEIEILQKRQKMLKELLSD